MTSRVRINASNTPVLFYAVPDDRDAALPKMSFDCRVVSFRFTSDEMMVLVDVSGEDPTLPGYHADQALPTSAHVSEYLSRNGFVDTTPEIVEMTPGRRGDGSRCVYLAAPSKDLSAFSPLAWMDLEQAGETLSETDMDAIMIAMTAIADAES